MTDQINEPQIEEQIQDEEVCNIQFYYDGLTRVPKYKISRVDERFMDPVAVYAMACVDIIEEQQDAVLARMEEYIEKAQTQLSIH